jgi:hypothetical protein
MKHKNVHRGLSQMPTSNGSSDTHAPRVGKIAKIHRNYKGKRTRQRSSRSTKALENEKNFRDYVNYFVLLAAACLCGLIIWIIYKQFGNNTKRGDSKTLLEETFIIPHPSQAECLAIVDKFLSAEDPEKLAAIARLNEFSAAQAYALVLAAKKADGEKVSMEWNLARETNGLSLETVFLTYQNNKNRLVFLLPDDQGKWRVDVASYLRYGTKPWSELSAQGSCKAEVRVIISLNNYYNGLFVDEKEWVSFALTSADHDQPLRAYANVNSRAFKALIECLRASNPAPVTLEISRDAGMEPRQFEIKRVIAQDWVESDKAFSDGFKDGDVAPK